MEFSHRSGRSVCPGWRRRICSGCRFLPGGRICGKRPGYGHWRQYGQAPAKCPHQICHLPALPWSCCLAVRSSCRWMVRSRSQSLRRCRDLNPENPAVAKRSATPIKAFPNAGRAVWRNRGGGLPGTHDRQRPYQLAPLRPRRDGGRCDPSAGRAVFCGRPFWGYLALFVTRSILVLPFVVEDVTFDIGYRPEAGFHLTIRGYHDRTGYPITIHFPVRTSLDQAAARSGAHHTALDFSTDENSIRK